MTDQTRDIHSQVREHYGQIAAAFQLAAPASCCGPQASCGCSNKDVALNNIPTNAAFLYNASDVQSLPEDVTGLSLGCGDPVTLASLQPGQTVLDLGSGGGIDCFLAARKVGPNGRVIGVDMTPAMLEKARANRAKLGAENVEFRLGEIEHLPAADNTVDVIISNCVVNLSPDKPQVFREAFRVLKPGGRLAVSDIVTDGPLPQAIKDNLTAWAGCVAGALEVKDYIAAIQAAGFGDVQVQPVYLPKEVIDEGLKQLGSQAEAIREASGDAIYRTVFSAKITAYKL